MRTEAEIRDRITSIKIMINANVHAIKTDTPMEDKRYHIDKVIECHEQLIALNWVLGVEWLP